MNDTTELELNDGQLIPTIGLGLWKVTDQAQFNQAFDVAIEAGYRHFDSAQAYGNEDMLGSAVKRSGIPRDRLFITTKIAVQHFCYNNVLKSFDESLKKLQMNQVDLLLLHFPVSVLRKKAWRALEEIQAAGKAVSIGVSNYTVRHLEEMQSYAKVTPAVNQVELHVFLQQPELLEYCHQNNIVVEAYSPLAHAKEMSDPVIASIAKKHGKSYAQVMLRWCLQRGLVPLPKSVNPERIRENYSIFGFELDKEDMESLTQLDNNLRTCWSPVHVP